MSILCFVHIIPLLIGVVSSHQSPFHLSVPCLPDGVVRQVLMMCGMYQCHQKETAIALHYCYVVGLRVHMHVIHSCLRRYL